MRRSKRNNHRYVFIDLFSGPGGLSLGFKSSGYFQPVLAIETVGATCETYRRNFKVRVCQQDVTRIDPMQLAGSARQQAFGRIDVVIGGPPCRAFTTANRGGTKWEQMKKKMLEEKNVAEHPDWFSFWKIIQAIQPRIFLAENVMGFRARGDVLQNFVERLESSDYATGVCELDAQYFGVPQRRRRIFVIGMRNFTGDKATLLPRNPSRAARSLITVEQALSDLPELSNDLPGSTISKYKRGRPSAYEALLRRKDGVLNDHVIHLAHPVMAKRFQYIPQGYNLRKTWIEGRIPESVMRSEYLCGKSIKKFSEKTLENMHSNIYRRLEWKKVSCTITNVRKTVLIHPLQDRLLSVRETARLQSFPDWFRFCGSLDQQYQQIADAVPPLLAKAIAEHFAKLLSHEDDVPHVAMVAEDDCRAA